MMLILNTYTLGIPIIFLFVAGTVLYETHSQQMSIQHQIIFIIAMGLFGVFISGLLTLLMTWIMLSKILKNAETRQPDLLVSVELFAAIRQLEQAPEGWTDLAGC
jgi:hypothetical protein